MIRGFSVSGDLFDRMGVEWGKNPVELDQKLLEKQKSKQVEKIKSVVSELVD